MRSKGISTATWAFGEDQGKTFNLEFHVLADYPCDILIGAQFLEQTETLSVHHYRLKQRIVRPRDFSFVNLCGSPTQRLVGLLNSEPISALSDTGSEGNLMSEMYAREHGLVIDTSPDAQGFLQFADGTMQETLGQVTTKWAFGDDAENPIIVTFKVLSECAYDVILGQGILYQHQAYVKHRACLVDTQTEHQGKLALNLVGPFPHFLKRIMRQRDKGTCIRNEQHSFTD